jgi:pyruvate dehydrogenase E2 component (dihydrolipoamide acetyltransferase)
MTTEFKLPELGENVESGDVVAVLVAAGDPVEVDQPVLELETDKATIEVPSSVSGVVKEVRVKAGEQAQVGQVIFTVETDGAAPAAKEAPEPEVQPEPEPTPAPEPEPAAPPPPQPAAAKPAPVSPPVAAPSPKPDQAAPAAPSVRRLARELGVDINQVPGTGPGGRISQDDVKAYVKKLNTDRVATPVAAAAGAIFEAAPLPDFSKWGQVERETFTNVRRVTARHMTQAWATIPHVTNFDQADITGLEKLRKRYAKKAEAAGGKLTVTAIILKVVAAALKQFPKFNASIDMANQEIVYKKYYHIGVAVDTDRGLLVPVIRNVDQKNIIELSVELSQLAEKARARKVGLDDLEGASFTITNLGGIGGTNFTPIINAPDVAILGIARGRMEAVFIDGQFEPRLILPLSLSYDHRLIDGADAARFLRWLVEALEQPFLLALEG